MNPPFCTHAVNRLLLWFVVVACRVPRAACRTLDLCIEALPARATEPLGLLYDTAVLQEMPRRF